jgi:hypothetical protein
MGTYIPKTGRPQFETVYREPTTEKGGRYIPGKKTDIVRVTYPAGLMYPVRFGANIYGNLDVIFDPRDIRNPDNWGSPQSFTSAGQFFDRSEDASVICEGGATCCVDISCSNTGGCGYSLSINSPDRRCNSFCQSYADTYGSSPGGCPEPYNSECQTCSEISDTVTDIGDYEGLSCRCGNSTAPECTVCNQSTGQWTRVSWCGREDPKPDPGECVCSRPYCSSSYTVLGSWSGSPTPPPPQNGFRYAGFAKEDSSSAVTYFYCSLEGKGGDKCYNTVTGLPCCPPNSSDKCFCTVRKFRVNNGPLQTDVVCRKECDDFSPCDPIGEPNECTPSDLTNCSTCEVCNPDSLTCVPDPSCGPGCGSIDLGTGSARPCNCHSECNPCELCNQNGRCYPDPACSDCAPT